MRGTQKFRMLGCALILVCTTGCSETNEQITQIDPWNESFVNAIASAESEFVRKVLQDHYVSDEESRESRDSYVDCLESVGMHPVVDPNLSSEGLGVSIPTSEMDLDKEYEPGCYDKWVGDIDYLYWEPRSNPKNENLYDRLAACYLRLGLVPEGFTGKDLDELTYPYDIHVSSEDDPSLPQKPEKTGEPLLPGSGVPVHGDETGPCNDDPNFGLK